MNLVERVARVIASEQGDDFDLAFASKAEWIAKRGVTDNAEFRDINAPMKADFICAATGVIGILLTEVERHLSAVQYDPAPYTAMKHRLAQLRKEALD